MTLDRQVRITATILALVILSIGLSCSSASQSTGNGASPADSLTSPMPGSRLIVDNVSAEFRSQAEIMDRHCEYGGTDWSNDVGRLLDGVNKVTGKRITLKQFYDRAARFAPELARDPEVSKLHEDTYRCEELLGRTIKDLSGI